MRALYKVERACNKLPDPVIIFLFCLFVVWVLSATLFNFSFSAIDPKTAEAVVVNNLLTSYSLIDFLSPMVKIFTGFAPLGLVWTVFLLAYWGLGLPLGIQSSYVYPAG